MNEQTQLDANSVQLALVRPEGLSQRQENFARHYVEHGSAVGAYCHAYNVAPTTNRNSLRSMAYNVLHHPKVAARVAVLQAVATDRTVASTASLLAALEEMVDADVNEIMTLTVGACRHCWGNGHAYQFRDELEHARAIDAAVAASQPLPVFGGYGYRNDREPHADCPICDGVGLQRVRFNNTADVSRGARRLFKGVELYSDGSVKKVLLHDQTALRIELHSLRGMKVDRSVSLNLRADIKPLPRGMSVEEALAIMQEIAPATDDNVVSEQ